jgi:hypothetical protein
MKGALVAQMIRCNKPNCRCTLAGARHGPYFCRIWREGKRRFKQYVRKQDVPLVRGACVAFREQRRQERSEAQQSWTQWREQLAELRDLESYE